MTKDSFEIMKHWIPLGEYNSELEEFWRRSIPVNTSETETAWNQAAELAKEGWELVGTIPVSGGLYRKFVHDSFGYSITVGYVLIFKRRIQE